MRSCCKLCLRFSLAAAAPVAAAGVGVAAVSSLASAPAETALVNRYAYPI